MPNDKFRDEIENLLTGASDPPTWSISSSTRVSRWRSRALEICLAHAGLGPLPGILLELICADFLAAAALHLENDQEILPLSAAANLSPAARATTAAISAGTEPSSLDRSRIIMA
jgi:hypothetical protein